MPYHMRSLNIFYLCILMFLLYPNVFVCHEGLFASHLTDINNFYAYLRKATIVAFWPQRVKNSIYSSSFDCFMGIFPVNYLSVQH